jgi:Methyltransferase domain
MWASLPSFYFTPKRHSQGGLGPWSGHLPFACDLVAAARPALIVELGTYYGESYFGFCQAVEEQSLCCTCYSIDTWRGDDQGGHYDEEVYLDVDAYNRRHYASFSNLRRMTFDEARGSFAEESIDILHIDGHHSYESVAHDFENWFSAVRPGGIVLLHDVSVQLPGFGVWRLWEELSCKYQTYTFPNSFGLGVLRKPGGDRSTEFLDSLLDAGSQQEDIARYYAACSEHLRLAFNASESSKAPAGSDRCAVQIFYSLATPDYREEHSAIQVIKTGEWHRLIFAIPYGVRAKPLRVDPADRPSVIEFRDIRVKGADSRELLWRWDSGQTSQTVALDGTASFLTGDIREMIVLSTGFDPQLLLLKVTGPKYEQPLRLELLMKVTAPASWIERISNTTGSYA